MKIILGQVLNSDFNIGSEKIVNAFNIALLSSSIKRFIRAIFKSRIRNKKDLTEKYKE